MFQTRWQNWRQFSLILLVVFSGMLIHPGAPVHAADITVNATCSLADAITAANTDTATGDCPAGSAWLRTMSPVSVIVSAPLPAGHSPEA